MRLLRRNVILIYGVHAVGLASGLVVTPIIVAALGTEQFGIWALIGSILGFIGLLDLGIGPSVIRFAAEQRGRNAHQETSELTSTAFAIYLVLALVTSLLAVVLAWLLPLAIEISDEYVRAAQVAVVLAVGSFVIRFPIGLFGFLLAGQQRYDVLNIGNLLGAVLYFALAAGILYLVGGGLVTLTLISVVAMTFRLVLPLFWLKRELPELSLQRRLVTVRQAKELLSFSSRNMLIQVASKVVFSTDVIVVGVIFGSVAAGVYGIPAKLFALAYVVGTASTTLLFPLLSELEGADDQERQERYLLSGVRLGLAVVVAVGLPLVVLPDRFLEAWLPADFDVSTSGPILAILMVSLLFAQPGHLLAQFLVARGRHSRLAVARLATVVVNLLLSIGLALWVGLWGVALATFVTEALSVTVVMPYLLRRESSVSLRALAGAWLRPVGLGALAAIPTLLVLGLLFEVDTLVAFAAVGLCWLVLYSALVWRFAMHEPERRTISEAFGRGSTAVAEADQPLL
ncbi:MAG TPA: oligosaccharide flippase family protein [Gaiellaceae bacterium]|nr:oligosaccharide flippase family protein [Gaiellaceae bacterium]